MNFDFPEPYDLEVPRRIGEARRQLSPEGVAVLEGIIAETGDLEQPPLRREETAEPRSDVAGTGEATRTGGTPPHDAEEQETASVRVYKRVR